MWIKFCLHQFISIFTSWINLISTILRWLTALQISISKHIPVNITSTDFCRSKCYCTAFELKYTDFNYNISTPCDLIKMPRHILDDVPYVFGECVWCRIVNMMLYHVSTAWLPFIVKPLCIMLIPHFNLPLLISKNRNVAATNWFFLSCEII